MAERKMTPEEFELVQANAGLAQKLFHVYYARLRQRADFGVDQHDLLSQAYYGLVRAAMRYRAYGEERGYSEESIASGQYFSVFARKSIIGQMLDSLRKVDHVHTLVRKDYKLLVQHGLGSGEHTDQEIADAANISLERLQKVVQLVHSRPVSLEDSLSSEQTVGDQLASTSGSVETSATVEMLKRAYVARWKTLSDEQQVIIAMKYYQERELPDIAEELGLSLAAARRLHTDALLELQESWESRLN